MLDYFFKTSESAADQHPSLSLELIENNRKTEIDFIYGALLIKGKNYDISTPHNERIPQSVHEKEELKGAK